MERRIIVAVLLMMAVVFVVQYFFPPPTPPERPPPPPVGRDADTVTARDADTSRFVPPPELREPPAVQAQVAAIDTVWVNSPLYRLGFSSVGATLISAEMLAFESLAPATKGEPVQLVPPGSNDFLSHGWLVGDDTLDLQGASFEVTPPGGLTLAAGSRPRSLKFVYQHPDAPFRVEIGYSFYPEGYVIDVQGRLSGAPTTGWWLLGLGSGLESNESDPSADYREYLSYVVKGPEGAETMKVKDLEDPGQRAILEGPFDWVAVRTKYFVSALVLPPDAGPEARFAGLRVTRLPESYRARGVVSFSLSRDGSFSYDFYLGPQDHRRLSAVGHDLDQVAPYGYKWLQPVMRPLASAITSLMVWSHNNLRLGYGWILILFGIGIRVLLFPLYQKSMRSQMATMRVQPLMKEIQTKYKHDPQRLQQEMMKLYREHKINPLGGCLPMLLPFPVLIALFFVFRDTIEFRGVPFLWLPDLSRPDPLYIIPVLMGASLFVLQWVGMRGMTQPNPQMKTMMYVMPVMMVVLFFRFAAGLNLYYATMNLASLPQQLYLARERKAAAQQPAPASAKT